MWLSKLDYSIACQTNQSKQNADVTFSGDLARAQHRSPDKRNPDIVKRTTHAKITRGDNLLCGWFVFNSQKMRFVTKYCHQYSELTDQGSSLTAKCRNNANECQKQLLLRLQRASRFGQSPFKVYRPELQCLQVQQAQMLSQKSSSKIVPNFS